MGLASELEAAAITSASFASSATLRKARRIWRSTLRSLAGGRFVTIPRSGLSRLTFDRAAPRTDVMFGDQITTIREDGNGAHVGFERRRRDASILSSAPTACTRTCASSSSAPKLSSSGPRLRDRRLRGEGLSPARRRRLRSVQQTRGHGRARHAKGRPHPVPAHFRLGSRRRGAGHGAQKTILRETYADGGWECAQILDRLDAAPELYFDRVSQICMPRWSKGRVALVGDAAFCVSLAAGQGSALAMTAAYALAGELRKRGAGTTRPSRPTKRCSVPISR